MAKNKEQEIIAMKKALTESYHAGYVGALKHIKDSMTNANLTQILLTPAIIDVMIKKTQEILNKNNAKT